MEKFSVKKPFTVLVAVIMVLMLGFVSITKMKTNLLPNVSTPYLMVVTVYPGASPERVETEVSDVLQNALTVPGVSKITATSAENYSLLLMQFVDDTDMDSALVQVSNKLDQAKSDLPETALTPSVIQYSMNMNAFMTVAVSREGSSVYDLSDFIKNTMTPYVQRKGGVSSVSSSGLVEQLVQVQLNQEKVDAINEKLMELIDTQLEVAHTQLEEAEAKIKAGRAEYDKQFKNFGNTVSNTVMGTLSSEVGEAVEVVRKQAEALLQSVNNLIAVVKEPEVQQALIEVQAGLQRVMDKFNNTGMRDIDSLIEIVSELRDITDKLSSALQTLQNRINTETGTQGEGAADLADELQLQDSLNVIYKTLEDTIKAMDNVPGMMSEFSKALGNFTQQQMVAYMQFTEAREQLNEYEKQLSEAKTQYEAAKEKALASADVTKQLDIKTLATLIYAQNFSMPAGYVKDESGESWLLKVGEEYDSVDDIRGALLLHVEGYGDVRLSDVADVEIIDNAADSYTRLNGEQASVLKIYKDDSSSAGDVSANCLDAFKELEAQYEGLHVVVLSNQGNYISIIVSSILSSMLIGAALAIIVLAIFLKDIKPTLVVGISIPLSVLFAVVLLPVLVVNDVGMGDPFFCKYICPQGVLEGAIPLAAANAGIRSALGHLFTWKLAVLIAVVVLSVLFYRPFCKWICPLGAFYALMNKVSLLGIRVDACKCVSCGKCSKVCQMDVDVVRAPNHAECIRCGKCIGACPVDAISYRYGLDVSAEKIPLTADKK